MNKNTKRQKKRLIAFNLLSQQLVRRETVLNNTVQKGNKVWENI